MPQKNRTAWAWVPSLYFFEGLPYFIVNTISVIILKRLGLGNGDVAMYTGLLYLPWVIKPLWSPFVDVLKTKRWWILVSEVIMCLCIWWCAYQIHADVLDKGRHFYMLLGLFWVTAFASATHDIAADGFYMLALDEHRATQFVGIRNTFYRIASVFGQGVLVMLAGVLELRYGDIPGAWRTVMIFSALFLAVITLWHNFFALPFPDSDGDRLAGGDGAGGHSVRSVAKELAGSFATFFRKDGIVVALLFMLLYRLPEAFVVKMMNPFFLDSVQQGGLGLETGDVGLVYGTFGAAALIAGGILGGLVAGRWGLKRCMWAMALSLTLPCAVFLLMALYQPSDLWLIGAGVCLDQFGYGFGFTAYTLYLMYFSRGEYKTSHYSICTAFMALSMMLPGMVAGYIQEAVGYPMFFIIVILCFVATFVVVASVKVDSDYGKKVD